jgi:Uma2 family endonuclease
MNVGAVHHLEQAMSLAQTTYEIEYPESDGKPLAETDLHLHWTIRIRDILKNRYRAERTYVGTDLLIYFVEGNPRMVVAPDVFVVKDCNPSFRRTFKVWEEGRVPNVVIEVTSNGTRREDEIFKPKDYAEIGVPEYFLYDPSAEYLRPPLQGNRLIGNRYEPIEPDARGLVECRSLGITLELDGCDLVLREATTGAVLLTGEEAAEAKRDAANAERDAANAEREAEHAARRAAEARAAALEQELKRLRVERGLE